MKQMKQINKERKNAFNRNAWHDLIKIDCLKRKDNDLKYCQLQENSMIRLKEGYLKTSIPTMCIPTNA